MTMATLSAQIPERELAIAALKLRMTDCTAAEISKAFILCELEGYTPAKAKEQVLSQRKGANYSDDSTAEVLSVRVPAEWKTRAGEMYPELSLSQFFRYCCHRLTESPETAMQRAKYPIGRPRKAAA